jgi:hypothetical protein
MNISNTRTTVAISRTTKARLDRWRAVGQCYDGFLCQIIELWERTHKVEDNGNSHDFKTSVENKISGMDIK